MAKIPLLDNEIFKESIFNQVFQAAPLGFLDIGARGGSHSLVEPLHTHVSFLGFEPDAQECDRLNQNAALSKFWNGFEVLPYALSNSHSQRTLHMISSLTNTSLLKPNKLYVDRYKMQQKWSITHSVPLDTVPLDHVIYDLNCGFKNSGEIIKVDTQGTELEILQGAQRLLTERTVCVVTEVEFFQIYEGQKLFSEVELFLRSLDFSFYGFLTTHTRSKKSLNKKTHHGKERLFYADAIFFKDPFSAPQNLKPRHYEALLFSAVLTGYYDFALEVAAAPQMNLAPKELTTIKNLIHSLAHVNPLVVNEKIHQLVNKIDERTADTNVYLGKFIDSLGFPDFEDCTIDS